MFKDSIVKFLKLENLVANLTGFVETRVELLKYELKEDISKVAARAGLYLMIAVLLMFFILFFSIGVALILSERLGAFWGFSIVSFFYIAIAIALVLNRESLTRRLEKGVKQIIQKKG